MLSTIENFLEYLISSASIWDSAGVYIALAYGLWIGMKSGDSMDDTDAG